MLTLLTSARAARHGRGRAARRDPAETRRIRGARGACSGCCSCRGLLKRMSVAADEELQTLGIAAMLFGLAVVAEGRGLLARARGVSARHDRGRDAAPASSRADLRRDARRVQRGVFRGDRHADRRARTLARGRAHRGRGGVHARGAAARGDERARARRHAAEGRAAHGTHGDADRRIFIHHRAVRRDEGGGAGEFLSAGRRRVAAHDARRAAAHASIGKIAGALLTSQPRWVRDWMRAYHGWLERLAVRSRRNLLWQLSRKRIAQVAWACCS